MERFNNKIIELFGPKTEEEKLTYEHSLENLTVVELLES